MGLFDRVRRLFERTPGPYEEAQKERVDAVRAAVSKDSPTLDFLRAMIALITSLEEDKVKGESRLLEDFGFGDLEIMEMELLCEDLFGIDLSSADMNLADTLQDLAGIIDKKREG